MTNRTLPRDAGSAGAFVTVLTAALLAMAGLVLDAGLAMSTKTRAMDAAHAAARVGADQLDLADWRDASTVRIDPAAAEAAAAGHLADAGHVGDVHATTSEVTVTVDDVYDTQLLGFVGVAGIDVSATAVATVHHGADTQNTVE